MNENEIGTTIVELNSVETVIAAHRKELLTPLSNNLCIRPSF